MTSIGSRPMQTPNLAGLLAKPPRRPRPTPPPVDETEPVSTTPAVPTPPSAPISTVNGGDSTNPERAKQTPPTDDPSADMSAGAGPEVALRTKKSRPKASAADEAQRPGTAATAQRQYLQSKAFNLPRSLHRRLGEQAAAQHTTRTALILTALNQTHAELAAVLQAQETGTPNGGDLFDIPQMRSEKEPSVQTTIRVTDQQLKAIDELVSKLGTNRSHLVAAALTTYLP